MKSDLEKFYEENLVCPEGLDGLTVTGQTITASNGRTYRFENNIPCFLSSFALTEHQSSELEFSKAYIQGIMDNSNPHYSPERPFVHPKVCWEWSEKWLNSETVHSDTKIVCIGGAFADDLPHVHSDYKFNIDHLANEYCKLLPEILKANTHHIACTSEKMPFRDAYADFVYARNSLDHVCNPVQTLKEAYRILKPGGKLLIGVYFNSKFIDEHESTVVDDEFIDRCIKPMFEIQHRVIHDTPQQKIFGGEKTGFICLVCRKLARSDLSFTQEQIQAVGDILSNFHSALYCEAHGKSGLAKDRYSRLLKIQPVLTTDVWRMIYSLIRFLGMTAPEKYNDLKKVIVNLLGHDPFWEEILDKTARDYAVAVSGDLVENDPANYIKILDAPDVIEGWRVLWYLAVAAHKIGRISVAERLAAAVINHAPDFIDARLFLETLDSPAVAHQRHIDTSSDTPAGHQPSVKENTLQQLKRRGLLHADQPLRLHLGCGERHLEGYINIDYPQSEHPVMHPAADFCADIVNLWFPPGTVDEVRLHHVFEHFDRVEALGLLIKWHSWLRKGGTLRIETPDIVGSAKVLLSQPSWKVKMGIVRHLSGDHAASWGYHLDHWFAERFEHTLSRLGFGAIKASHTSWQREPFLANVEITAVKMRDILLDEQKTAAEKLLWDSAVDASSAEQHTWQVWKERLDGFLRGEAESPSCLPEVSLDGGGERVDIFYGENLAFERPDSTYKLPPGIVESIIGDEANPLHRIARIIENNSKVLDIGAGSGLLGLVLAKLNKNVLIDAVEPSKAGVQEMCSPPYRRVCHGYLDNYMNELMEEKYDYVVLADVVEHLYDPSNLIKNCVQLLSNEGKLILSVPNVAFGSVRLSLLRGRFDYVDSGLLERTHLRFYTVSSLLNLISELRLHCCELIHLKRDFSLTEPSINILDFDYSTLKAVTDDPASHIYQFVLVLQKRYNREPIIKDYGNIFQLSGHTFESMKEQLPKVSILIPTFNRAGYLKMAIDSALAQTYPGTEILVLDDCSTDETANLSETYRSATNVKFIRNEKNIGFINNWNKAVALSSGEYIKIMGDDDILSADCVAEQVRILNEHPDVGVVCCGYSVIDESSRVKNNGDSYRVFNRDTRENGLEFIKNYLLLKRAVGWPTAILFRREDIDRVGGFDPQAGCPVDIDMWSRILKVRDFYYLDKMLAYCRLFPGNLSKKLDADDFGYKDIIRFYLKTVPCVEHILDEPTKQQIWSTLGKRILPFYSKAQDKNKAAIRRDMDSLVERCSSGRPGENVTALIFSKDRAMQLQATIESFVLQCRDNDAADITVLFKASGAAHRLGYDELREKFPAVSFVEETDFYRQVLSVVERREYVLFLVDDNIFVKPFSLSDVVASLDSEKNTVGFSLRLGKNTDYCYMLSAPQKLPAFECVREGIFKYSWPGAERDFGYPLEVSSAVYRSNEILRLLNQVKFSNPNTLESEMNRNSGAFVLTAPFLLTFEESVTFCNPVNVVQCVYGNNKFGTIHRFSAGQLADCFSRGMAIDVRKYAGFTPDSAHQEVELHFKPADLAASEAQAAETGCSHRGRASKPKFSIVMANYNNGRYIGQAIESVLSQTFGDWELVIVDDCSTDDSVDVINRFLTDGRIRLIRHDANKGYVTALKTAVAAVAGEVFGILDSDDCLAAHALETMYQHHVNSPDCGLIYSQFMYCDENLKPKHTGYCREIPPGKTNLDVDTVSHFKTFKLRDYLKTSGYDESMPCAEDKDIVYRMEEVTRLKFVDDCLYLYRELPKSQGHDARKAAIGRESMKRAKSAALERRGKNCSPTECFHRAKGEFDAGNFQQAAEWMEKYRRLADYAKLSRIVRTPRRPDGVDVSVIVVTYNRTDDVVGCLRSLAKQDDTSFETIVIDNGGTDFHSIEPYISQYVKCPVNFNLSEGRNIGACCAKGRILAFLDDDAAVPPDYVSSIKSAFKTYDIVGLRGKALPKSNPDANKNAKSYDKGNVPFPTFCDLEGGSAFLRRTYLAMDGMDPLLFGHEGSDLTYRIAKSLDVLNKVIYWPDTVIHHDATLGEAQRQRAEGYELMEAYLKWKHGGDIFALRRHVERQYMPPYPKPSDSASGDETACSIRDLKLHRLGSEYGGSVVALDLIAPGSTVISAGVGEDISFDLEIIKRKGCKVIGIDPTEKARNFVEKNKNESFEFIPKALYSQDRHGVTIYKSSRPDCVSESVTSSHRSVESSDHYEAQTISIQELQQVYPDISLLKMDVEGAEYEVLNSIETLDIPQIFLEFHHFCTEYTPEDTYKCIEHVKAMGYAVVHCRNEAGAPREITFVHKRCLAPASEPAAPARAADIRGDVPVVVIVYNRPKHTLEVLRALKQHDVKNIYIFSDAPKCAEHEQNVLLVRRLIHSIDWTTPRIIERQENFGLARNIVDAVDYVFREHEQLILLEDDCVPQQYFFDFVRACLEKYKDNPKVFGVSGYSVSMPGQLLQKYPYDLYFSPRIGSWGWATWRRAWQHYGRDLRKLVESANEKGVDLSQGGTDIPIFIEKFLTGRLSDVWTLNWVLSVYLKNGCYVYPTHSHVKNIGTDGSGLHCSITDKYDGPCAAEKPACYPDEVVIDGDIIENFKSYYKADGEQSRRAAAFLTSIGKSGRRPQVALVSTTDNRGGAAKVAWMLKKGLAAKGFQAKMFVKDRFSDDRDVLKITDPALDGGKELENQGLLYYGIKSTALLARNPDFTNCDIFHFHNLHGGYFNPFALPELTRIKPSVWTLHDMQGITGHCAYAFDCDKWQTGCGDCPNLETYPAVAADQTAKMWRDKRRIYADSDIEIIVPSQWLKNVVEKSILKDKKVHLIYNGIDGQIYRPYDKSAVRRQLRLPDDAIVIAFAADKGLLEQRKGGSFILEAYKYFAAKYPNLYFMCIGSKADNAPTERFLQIPFVADEAALAQIYCAADVFMFPTLADNCPLVVLELMGCGVPVVSFDVGGVPELIEHGRTGFLAQVGDIRQLVGLTEQLVLDESARRRFGQAALATSRERFTLDRMIDDHVRLYETLVQKRLPGSPDRSGGGSVSFAGRDPAQKRYLVTAIVSTYNSQRFIRGCLDDLESQTIAGQLEIIVVNTASEQNEETIVKEFQSKYSNIVYIVTDKREPLYSAWNRAVKVASGQFLTNANTDDRHRKDALEVMANTLLANPDVALVYGDQIVTDTADPTFENHHAVETAKRPEFSRQRLLFGCCVGSQPMWRKSLHGEFGGFDETLTCAADWDFWLNVASKYTFKHVPEFLGLYYRNEDGIEHGQKIHSFYERYLVGRRYGNPYISVIQPYQAPDNPLVSVVMPAYNAADYIARAIESVLIQNYRNFELIVVDDGSSDHTADIVRGFKNEPIKYFLKENGGAASARNFGLEKASGSFIVMLDSDDMMTPDYIARHLQGFEQHPQADMVYCDDLLIDEQDKPIRVITRPEYSDPKAFISDMFRCGFPVVHFKTCIRRSVFDKIGPYDERLIVGEDYDMMRRFVKQGLRMVHLPLALYLRRLTTNGLSRNFSAAKAKSHFDVIHRFTETFTPDQLFPDVQWDELPVEEKPLLVKCKTALVYLGIGEQYLGSNTRDYAAAAFEMACAELDDCCKIEPDNQQFRNLREKCYSIRDRRLSSDRKLVCQPV